MRVLKQARGTQTSNQCLKEILGIQQECGLNRYLLGELAKNQKVPTVVYGRRTGL